MRKFFLLALLITLIAGIRTGHVPVQAQSDDQSIITMLEGQPPFDTVLPLYGDYEAIIEREADEIFVDFFDLETEASIGYAVLSNNGTEVYEAVAVTPAERQAAEDILTTLLSSPDAESLLNGASVNYELFPSVDGEWDAAIFEDDSDRELAFIRFSTDGTILELEAEDGNDDFDFEDMDHEEDSHDNDHEGHGEMATHDGHGDTGTHDPSSMDAGHHSAAMALVDVVLATHTAIASGNWTNPATWENGILPAEAARIVIPAGISVTIDSVIPTAFKTIRIDGALRFATDVNTELRVDTLVSTPSGRLEIGTAENPVAPNVTARVIFADFGPIDRSADPAQLGRGALLHGQTVMYGTERLSWTSLAVHPRAGDSTLQLDADPTGWQPGDVLVVATTDRFDVYGDEKVTVVAVDGRTVLIDRALERDHVAPLPELDVHVANLTRNIEFSSENPTVAHRAHMMFMHTLDADVNYVRYFQMGRTDKRVMLDDYAWPELDDSEGMPLEGNNIRGRYSVHFHRGGSDIGTTPARVVGSVVEDDIGWAYVNHSSNVDFIGNVSYNVIGGAYQTESGDEIGSFVSNIALRTVNPELPLRGTTPEVLIDIREDRQDFAFQGDGFWLHGGGVRVDNNVVSGASGHAYVYWPEGLIEFGMGMMHVQTPNVPNGHLLGDLSSIDVWWLQVASFDGNVAYSATKGLEFYYMHTSFFEGEGARIPQAYKDQLTSTFENLTFWSMHTHAIGLNYNERLTFRNIHIIGDGDPNSLAIDANHFHVLDRIRFENMIVEGFGVGMDVPTQGDIVIEGGTYSNLVDFRIMNPQLAGRTLQFNNISFGEHPAFAGNPNRVNLLMNPDFTLYGQIQDGLDGIEDGLGSKHELFFLMPDRITLNFGPFENMGLYFNEQVPDFVPFVAENNVRDEGYLLVSPEYVDLSNQQLLEQYGMMFGQAYIPSDAAPAPGIIGGVVGSPATNATIELPLFDEFDFDDCDDCDEDFDDEEFEDEE